MTNSVLHLAADRGHADHGWLNAHHTFSFAGYHNPEVMNFGVLRVLNDDVVAGGRGFGMHPHDNMEIITIPLEGDLQHKDSMGNTAVINHGKVQVMSAGTGVYHSEMNNNADKPVKLLQIWMFPNKRDVTPRYDEVALNATDRHNQFQQVLSPSSEDAGVWVHQNAWFSIGKFEQDFATEYTVKSNKNGVYAFVISGKAEINGQILNQRDGFGVWNTEALSFKALEPETEVLLMDVPMEISF